MHIKCKTSKNAKMLWTWRVHIYWLFIYSETSPDVFCTSSCRWFVLFERYFKSCCYYLLISCLLFCPLCFTCTWFELKTIVKKYLLPQVGSLIAVGTGYWIICFTIKKEKWPLIRCTDAVCGSSKHVVCWYIYVSLLWEDFFFLAIQWKISQSSFTSCSCSKAFSAPTERKKNGTLNTGNTNLLVNLAEKQIVLHNRKLSCTKGPLYCITALATCFIKTLAMHFF